MRQIQGSDVREEARGARLSGELVLLSGSGAQAPGAEPAAALASLAPQPQAADDCPTGVTVTPRATGTSERGVCGTSRPASLRSSLFSFSYKVRASFLKHPHGWWCSVVYIHLQVTCIFNVYLHVGVPSTHSSLQDKEWLAAGAEPGVFPAILQPLRKRAVCMALPLGPSVALVVEAFSDLRKNLRSCLLVGTDVHSRPPPGLPKAW